LKWVLAHPLHGCKVSVTDDSDGKRGLPETSAIWLAEEVGGEFASRSDGESSISVLAVTMGTGIELNAALTGEKPGAVPWGQTNHSLYAALLIIPTCLAAAAKNDVLVGSML
jgi:hypothetical protein